jgi:hypothetical protein
LAAFPSIYQNISKRLVIAEEKEEKLLKYKKKQPYLGLPSYFLIYFMLITLHQRDTGMQCCFWLPAKQKK